MLVTCGSDPLSHHLGWYEPPQLQVNTLSTRHVTEKPSDEHSSRQHCSHLHFAIEPKQAMHTRIYKQHMVAYIQQQTLCCLTEVGSIICFRRLRHKSLSAARRATQSQHDKLLSCMQLQLSAITPVAAHVVRPGGIVVNDVRYGRQHTVAY
jgi:hypothetical protein